jgi:hypothetical protein
MVLALWTMYALNQIAFFSMALRLLMVSASILLEHREEKDEAEDKDVVAQ